MTKSILLTALTSSALLAVSPVPAFAQTLEPAAAGFAEAAASGQPIYELSYPDARAVLARVQADKVEASAPTTTQTLSGTSARPARCGSALSGPPMRRGIFPQCFTIMVAAG